MKRARLTAPQFEAAFLSRLLVATCVLTIGHSVAHAQSADSIVDRLQAKYESIDGLEATFTQTMSSEYLDAPETASGKVILSGKRVRIETSRQTFVSDGLVTWLYDARTDEVLINDYVEEEMFPVREFLFDYEQTYDVLSVEDAVDRGSDVQVVRMRARDETTPYRDLTISVRDLDDVISRIELVDVNETRMVFELEDVVLNPTITSETFTFSPPAGSEVIDLRS